MSDQPNQPNGNKRQPSPLRGVFALAAFAGLTYVTINAIKQASTPPDTAPQVSYSVFEDHVKDKKIDRVVIQGTQATGFDNETTPDIPDFKTVIPTGTDVYSRLDERGAEVTVKPVPPPNTFLMLLMSFGPMLLFLGLFIFMMRGMAKGAGGALSVGKSKAKIAGETSKVKFSDVAGADEAKEEVQELVEFLKDPAKFSKTGGVMPRGALLVGPPGTGKTLLAKAVAGEAGRPFFQTSGSDFVEMFVGVGASRVRDLFEQAKANAPCVIFIDEIDAVGRHRGAGLGGGHDEREQTLNQLLVEMDGFETNSGVVILAATNRPDVLDPALLRPGRLTRQVVVSAPDLKGREQILMVHAKNKPLNIDVDLSHIAKETSGMVGADLANVLNEAALLAVRKERNDIDMETLREAIDKVIMGPQLKSRILTPAIKERVAYHEAGHALMSLFVPGNDPLVKVNIQPRGKALGVTWSAPDEDQFLLTESQMKARLVMLYGGRMAEEIVYGKENITTGASNDIERASELARKMVTQYGFSDELGRVNYGGGGKEIFLAQSFAREGAQFSEKTEEMIDSAVRRITDEAYERARQILIEHRSDLEILKNALLDREILTADEVRTLIKLNNLQLPPANDSNPPPSLGTGTSGPS